MEMEMEMHGLRSEGKSRGALGMVDGGLSSPAGIGIYLTSIDARISYLKSYRFGSGDWIHR